jgi:hypothetical protein
LPQAVQEAKVVLFADDTNILLIEKNLTSLQEKTVNVMKQLENWFLSNNLIINTGKTKAILFQGNGSSSIHRSSLYFNNKEITYTSNLNLGIHITDNLSWSTHIQYLCQKLNKVLYLIKSLHDSVSKPILRNMYFTKFESILRYGIIFWGGVNDSNAVFIIQKKKFLKL